MLQARNQDGVPVILANFKRSVVERMRAQQRFYCPVCGERVIVKAGRTMIAHFSHSPNSSCADHKGEGEYHERGKLHLFQWLRNQGLDATLEKYLPEIGRRPDVLLRLGKKVIALEFQCAALDREELYKRTEDYRKLAIEPLWILGGNRLKRTGARKIRLTSMDRSFLTRYNHSSSLLMNFYCPNTGQFCLFRQIQSAGNGNFYGDLHFLPLRHTQFRLLLQDMKQFQPFLLESWLQEKQKFRTKPPSKWTGRLHQSWRQWLYQKGYHQSLLPSYIYLPVIGQYRMKTPPWDWQSRLFLEYLMNLPFQRTVSLAPCYRLLKAEINPSSEFPLINSPHDPIREYLTLLESLHMITLVSDRQLKKQTPITFPENVEQALSDDRRIIQALQKQKSFSSINSHD
ncbi:competence protein CoiA [Sediminibacillus halophilus]|uniref:Competence protein CoiA-like family, contains a predicted nuclease domain n=1 Tax=Sediminibacillus halophilus TaxID=482461 RepID=A0A1G9PGW4_9BACI|nr:competence protein CoiA family protein [Sediminibacillus halophilus]SDL97979.1 Competence protein CoiA-like family, contains a predicted nuclease domain [Sediminibacillus halophilus]